MALQSSVNINLGFGVVGELLVDGPQRADSLILNSNGSPNAIGNVVTLNAATMVASIGGVVNPTGASSFTASISSTTMTVTAVASGAIQVGQTLAGTTSACTVTAYLTGAGGTGTYTVSVSQTFASGAVTGSGGTATIFGGVLVNPKTQSLVGTTSGTLTPTLNIPDNSQGSILSMGTIVVNSVGNAVPGDIAVYNVNTGAIDFVTPGAAYGNTNALVPNGICYRFPVTTSGLTALRLTN